MHRLAGWVIGEGVLRPAIGRLSTPPKESDHERRRNLRTEHQRSAYAEGLGLWALNFDGLLFRDRTR